MKGLTPLSDEERVGLNEKVSSEIGDIVSIVSKASGICSDDVRIKPVTSTIKENTVTCADKIRPGKQ